MLNSSEKAYYLALQALRFKHYDKALNYFHAAAGHFQDNREFQILYETTRLLVAVKEEIAAAGNSEGAAEPEEVLIDGAQIDFS